MSNGTPRQQHGSLGAFRVRESFNPSGNSMVDKIKRYTADLIDLCEELKPLEGRCASLAQTAYEEAAMWAVKAATAEQDPRHAAPTPGVNKAPEVVGSLNATEPPDRTRR